MEELAVLQYARRCPEQYCLYNLIETAKENGLDPYKYLKRVLETAPPESQKNDAWAEMFVPSAALETCKVPKTE